MTEHDKIEHELPNGDILIQDSTRTRPEVEAAFRKVEEEMAREAEKTYRSLREAATSCPTDCPTDCRLRISTGCSTSAHLVRYVEEWRPA